MVRGLVNVESKTKQGKYIRDWDGRLSENAKELITQHDFTIGISELQKSAV